MKRILGFALAVAVIATACSENTTNPSTTDSYMAKTTGAYTVNNMTYIETDTTTGERKETNMGQDSVVVSGTASKTDDAGTTKTAIMHIQYIGGQPNDTTYYAEEGSKIYLLYHMDFEVEGVDPVDAGTRWVLVADQSSSSEFTGLNVTINDLEIDYNGVLLPASVTFSVKGIKQGSETVNIGGTNVPALRFKNTFGVTVTITAPIIGTINIPVVVESIVKYGKNRGVIYNAQEPTPISVPQLGFEFEVPGYRIEAVRMSN
jgi:hypothetical protein